MTNCVIVRGAGDLATGTIVRLVNSGFRVLLTECAQPSAIRRRAALSEAVYDGVTTVEGVTCRKIDALDQMERAWQNGEVPLIVDETGESIRKLNPTVVVDAILAKRNLGTTRDMACITVALGPGFTAGEDVDAVIETMRGHSRGPADGALTLVTDAQGQTVDIGSVVHKDDVIAMVGETPVYATLDGVLRGLIRPGYAVTKGLKIADIDPRMEQKDNCDTISDKARNIAGGVLEAILHLSMQKGVRCLDLF